MCVCLFIYIYHAKKKVIMGSTQNHLLYTLNGQRIWNIYILNYTSIKLLQMKKKERGKQLPDTYTARTDLNTVTSQERSQAPGHTLRDPARAPAPAELTHGDDGNPSSGGL